MSPRFDIVKCLDHNSERRSAILAFSESKQLRGFGSEIIDCSTSEKEYEAGLFPLSKTFFLSEWRSKYSKYWQYDPQKLELEANFTHERLLTVRKRYGAVYQGLSALLRLSGAIDWITGEEINDVLYFEEKIDSHHIFPVAWCRKQGIDPKKYNCLVNRTPLSAKTNKKIGSKAPSVYLKELTEKNTPLINEILVQVGKHPEFETWLEKGSIPAELLKTLGNSLKTQEPFTGQPGRFYTSAIALVDYVYRSWFALQKRRKNQIEGKQRWLKMLKSDPELEQESQSSLEVIRTKATELLTKFTPQSDSEALRRNQNDKPKKGKKTKKSAKTKTFSLFKILFNTYEETEEPLTLKNEVIAYRSVKQLLGKNYNLLNRQRQQQQRLSHECHKAQKQNAPNSFGESELGQYTTGKYAPR